ncbi:MAG: CRISPR-associated endonuclease Cas2 [Thermoproteus sp.]
MIYDISDDELRLKVADFLKSRGLVRVQRSAFIGPSSTALKRDVEAGLRRLVQGRPAPTYNAQRPWTNSSNLALMESRKSCPDATPERANIFAADTEAE